MSTDLLERRAAARTPIEPRLRARRIEVARDRGRRRLRRVLGLLAVLALAALAVAATRSPLLDVDRVTVRGTDARADEVREAAGVALGEPLVSVDPGAVAGRVEELPWVADARVDRAWSGTIAIAVTARRAIAVVGAAPGVVVDADGVAFGPAPADADLPLLPGAAPEPGAPVADRSAPAVAVLAGLPDDLRGEVAEARADDGLVTLVLDDDIEVRWGDERQAGPKADALGAVLAEVDRSGVAVIDVTVPRATTVAPTPGE